MNIPVISICIPAYKRTVLLRQLLNSITIQTFTNFEVIITDDSPDDTVEILYNEFKTRLNIYYFKNNKQLGGAANFNASISKANGQWIKLMHDDDWFASPAALQAFADATGKGKNFIFSAYTNHFALDNTTHQVSLTSFWKQKIKKNPAVLIAKNVIGPPSVTLIHHSVKEQYDERLKWRTDTDFYERVLRIEKDYYYINKHLINVGISESQVTQSCLFKPEVELPEGIILLEKFGVSSLQNILVYDAWWRLLRNMHITTEKQLYDYTKKKWPAIIINMVKDLSAAPVKALQIGALSKMFMSLSYFKNRKKI